MADADPIGLITWLAQQCGDGLTPARQHFRGVLVANMGYTATEANAAIGSGALNAPDPASFYSPGPAGYTDYPSLDPQP